MKTYYKSTLLFLTSLCVNILFFNNIEAVQQCNTLAADNYFGGSSTQSLREWGAGNVGSNFQTDTKGLGASGNILPLLMPDLVPPNNPPPSLITDSIKTLIGSLCPAGSIGQSTVNLLGVLDVSAIPILGNPAIPSTNQVVGDLGVALATINPAIPTIGGGLHNVLSRLSALNVKINGGIPLAFVSLDQALTALGV